MSHLAASLLFLVCALSSDAFAQNLVIIRHGEADHNLTKTYSSRINTSPASALTENGRNQVKESASRLKEQGYGDQKISHIFVSPLLRTMQTSDLLIQILNLNAKKKTVEPLLIEPDMGILEGKTTMETSQYFPDGDDWNKEWAKKYKGETNDDLSRRMQALLGKLRKLKAKGDIILVTHGSPASALLSILVGPQTKEQRLKTADFRIIPLQATSLSNKK